MQKGGPGFKVSETNTTFGALPGGTARTTLITIYLLN